MTTTDRYLAGDEEIELEVRRHVAVLIRPATPALIALLIAFPLTFAQPPILVGYLVWFSFLASLLWFGWKWLERWLDRIVVTNQRIFLVQGVIVRRVAMMPLASVTDLGYTRSILGRLLGYGAVRLESAGQVQDLEHINHLPDPDAFYRRLTALVVGRPADPGQFGILREIRDELRETRRGGWA
ncbi:MAG: PH domain-containing protein [Egibacteraceae bacterium]